MNHQACLRWSLSLPFHLLLKAFIAPSFPWFTTLPYFYNIFYSNKKSADEAPRFIFESKIMFHRQGIIIFTEIDAVIKEMNSPCKTMNNKLELSFSLSVCCFFLKSLFLFILFLNISYLYFFIIFVFTLIFKNFFFCFLFLDLS